MDDLGNAYWISPTGRIFPVSTRHIEFIIANPRLFHLTPHMIEKVYHRYKEPIGCEGNARNEIIAELIKKGWIRVRFDPKQFSYTIQLARWGRRERAIIRKWMKVIDKLKKKKVDLIGVKIIGLDQNVLFQSNG